MVNRIKFAKKDSYGSIIYNDESLPDRVPVLVNEFAWDMEHYERT
jgi:hypothetical protein